MRSMDIRLSLAVLVLLECATGAFAAGEPAWSLAQLKPHATTGAGKFPNVEVITAADTPYGGPRLAFAARTPKNRPQLLTFSENGQVVAVAHDDGFWLLNLDGDKQSRVGAFKSPAARVLAIAPNCKALAVASDDSVKVWDLAKEEFKTRVDHGQTVSSLGFWPDSEVLAIGSGTNEQPSTEGGATFWSIVPRTERLSKIDTKTAAHALAFSPDHGFLAVGGWNGKVVVWDLRKKETRFTVAVKGTIACMAYSPDGKVLAVADYRGKIYRFDRDRGRELPTEMGHDLPVTSLAFSSDSGWMLSTDQEGRIIRWDLKSGEQRQDWKFDRTHAVTAAPDGAHVALFNDRGKFVLLRLPKP